MLSSKEIADLRGTVYQHYHAHGRDLPWRATQKPYHILVSEIMLQQTQVDRVIPKYRSFIKAFPSFAALARASAHEVLTGWQGLGYNRRALALHRCAQLVVADFRGRLPRSVDELRQLPGIGQATACSICAFAYNQPVVFLETNIRSVLIHHFFPKKKAVSDEELMAAAELVLDRSDPRKWYNALMDYGTLLKKELPNPARRSKKYRPQSQFEGSNRQLRSKILKLLLEDEGLTLTQISARAAWPAEAVRKNLAALTAEGFLTSSRGRFRIAT